MRGYVAVARISIAACGVLGVVSSACGGGGGDPRYPKRPDGCDVTVFHQTPDVATDNIGPVHAACSEDVAAEDCIRTLKDVVCKLGGDVVWGVGEPEKKNERVHYTGRAAHTKGAKASSGPKP